MLSKKIGFISLAVLAMLVAACTRSASQAPLATPTLDAGFPQPAETNDGMGLIEQLATQTAMAENPDAAAVLPAVEGTPVDGTPAADTTPGLEALPPLGVDTPMPTPVTPEPAAPAAVQPTTQAVATSGSYTLMAGEFPFCIARRYNVNQYELLSLNGLTVSQGNSLPVGYTLKIPQTGKTFDGNAALMAHPASYTVLAGDTIYGIACKYGNVNPVDIANANGLVAPYTLTVGSQLQIP